MYNSDQIANWFIVRHSVDCLCLGKIKEPITNMKLNKLMYFAQGTYLALYDERLFNDLFYAFELGPISNEIRKKYPEKYISELNDYISDKKAIQLVKNYYPILSDEKAEEALHFTWDEFGYYTASELVTISCDKDGPWAKVYKKGKCWIPINDDDIKEYFKDAVIECS